MTAPIVIIGSGVAGASAAQTLRSEGFAGSIIVVGEESSLPYRRPVLSKELLASTTTPQRALLKPATFWANNEIELRTGTRVVGLDVHNRCITLADRDTVAYESLLLATGARARELDHHGGRKVFTLRTIDDVEPLRAAIEENASLLVIGGGLIGCEVAAAARALGAEVTVLEAAMSPLSRIVPADISKMYVDLHAEHDVRIHTGVSLTSLIDEDSGLRATAADGRNWTAGAALVSIGSVPDTALAIAGGLDIDNGIVVDAQLRTSAAGVYAAGDVANQPNTQLGGRHRTEHWNSAQAQGIAAARSMLGQSITAAEIPWAWSAQYGHSLQFAGWPCHDDEFVVRGSVHERDFTALAVRDDRLVGAIAMGRPKDIRTVRDLMASGSVYDRAILADERVALSEVATSSREYVDVRR